MSLLSIVQRTARVLSLNVPSVVVSSTDPQVQQLWELANEEGDTLARDHDWQILRKEQVFDTVAQAEQTNWLAADIDRFVHDTNFNRSTRRNFIGPITPQQWQAIQAQPQLNRVFLAWIQRGGEVYVTPTPAAGETAAYEYISSNWAYDAMGTPKALFDTDSDETYLDERIIRYGVRWRFLAAKGLPYAEALQTYEIEKEKAEARDGGSTVINSTGRDQYILSPNIPEGSFPG